MRHRYGPENIEQAARQLQEWIVESQSAVAFTGAGISTVL
jgi:NAD-dependent SIR2 family protein deacetylase